QLRGHVLHQDRRAPTVATDVGRHPDDAVVDLLRRDVVQAGAERDDGPAPDVAGGAHQEVAIEVEDLQHVRAAGDHHPRGGRARTVAWEGRRVGTSVDGFMPSDAPEIKRRATESYGATIHEFDRASADREQLGYDWAAEHGAVMVHPYEDHDVMAGQGTAALEL